jgi:hypothetical protein
MKTILITWLDSNLRVCSTVRANRCIPCDLEVEGRCLKRGQSAFLRNGDIMVWVWKYKTCVIGDATALDKERKDREKNIEIKGPYAVVQYSKFLKGLHISSEVKLETFVNSAFRYTKVLALRNFIHLLTTRPSAVSEVSGSGA